MWTGTGMGGQAVKGCGSRVSNANVFTTGGGPVSGMQLLEEGFRVAYPRGLAATR